MSASAWKLDLDDMRREGRDASGLACGELCLAGAAEIECLRVALEESVKLQSHYAELLNFHDGGERMGFENAKAWMERLHALGTI